MISTVKKTSPLAWVPTVYFAMGLPFVVLNMVSAVMFKDMGISDARIAFWTSLIMWSSIKAIILLKYSGFL